MLPLRSVPKLNVCKRGAHVRTENARHRRCALLDPSAHLTCSHVSCCDALPFVQLCSSAFSIFLRSATLGRHPHHEPGAPAEEGEANQQRKEAQAAAKAERDVHTATDQLTEAILAGVGNLKMDL